VTPSQHYRVTVRVLSKSGQQSAGTSAEVDVGALTSAPYDVVAQYNGQPTAGVDILRFPFVRAVAFPAGLTGSYGRAEVAATAQADFTIRQNGGSPSIGTMRFAAAGTTATFIFPAPVTFEAGDVITITAPSPQDGTLADLSLMLKGTR
jgi:hypothetical protein